MKNIFTSYKKIISVLCLGIYLFVSGYSFFHLHKTNYFLQDAVSAEGKVYTDSSFHQNGFCQLFHFNSSQLQGDIVTISDCKPTEFLIKQYTLTSSLISSEINSLLRRGPPDLS